MTIHLSTSGETLVDTVQTVGNGNYMFSGVGAGDYVVTEVNPNGFVSTTPDQVDITVPPGGSATANFGDKAGYRIYLPYAMRQYPRFWLRLPIVYRRHF